MLPAKQHVVRIATRSCVPLLVLAGLMQCAAANPAVAQNSSQKISPAVIPSFHLPDVSTANNRYRMSAEELEYDCKKLTGHIAIRIRQLRSTRTDAKTSQLARTMQHAATPLMNGTTRGIDQDGDNARDLAMLQVYNGRLTAKNCPAFNLERLLAPGNNEAPRPEQKAKKPGIPAFTVAKPTAVKPAAPPKAQ